MSFLTPVWAYIDALVHPSARADALTAARHRAFIAPRLLGSFAALAAFPIYLVLRGMPNAIEVAVLAWLVAPISISYFLSRTGRLDNAQILSALSIAALVTIAAWRSGGINSYAAMWLAVVPLDCALSASRRVVAGALASTLASAILLLAATAAALIPPPAIESAHSLAATLGIVLATLFATGIALGAGSLVHTISGLLSAETDRFRLLARHTTDVVTRHGRNGAVTYVSPAAASLVGVPPNELLGHRLFDRVHVADRPAYLTALSDAAAAGRHRSAEFRVRSGGENAPGNFIWVEMRCCPLDEAVKGDDVIAVLRDVSERKLNEHALQIARADAERASAGKMRFLATMSHELRTPLNAIIGFSDMLGAEAPTLDPGRQREYARLINDSGRHLLSVVNSILDMSKMETGDFEMAPEAFAPALAISTCCDILALNARECGIEIKTHVADDLPAIVADRHAFNQILINLISNAIKFTRRGGHVTIGASCEAGNLMLTVQDTGVGINEDDLPLLGEAFFQVRGSYDRQHDGDMDIRSRPGEGTHVTVRLPIDRDRPAAEPIKFNRKSVPVTGLVASNNRVKKSA